MAVISKIFKPRRGLASTMQGSKAGTVLADGEMFIEVQGTTVGKAKCKMKMGDGTTAYSSLPYAMGDTSSDPITFTPNSATTAETALASATSGATLATIVAAMKRAISLNAESITQLNDDKISKNDSASYPSDIKHFYGILAVDASGTTSIIKAAIAQINTENKCTSFSCIVNDSGYHYFAGIIYQDKKYGSGVYISFNGASVLWRRYNSNDSFYNISCTQI